MGLIISLAICLSSFNLQASNELQLSLGESVSIYSQKAYRRNNGTEFEAVGNVVIISGNDTIYGERAKLNSKTGDVKIEGNVRYIGQNVTLYGSKISVNVNDQSLEMLNARMITPEFSIVASKISKTDKKKYYAKDAEFTTCRDCSESWVLAGKEVFIELDQYVQIYHGLARVKGIDVLYLPYIAIPIKNKRESGILFPNLYSHTIDDFTYFGYAQPFYLAFDDSKDMTLTTRFLGKRGSGLDMEYRQVIGEKKWFEIFDTALVDSIYRPSELNTEDNGDDYFRHHFNIEGHYQWSPDVTTHLHFSGVKDLDFYRDFSNLTEDTLVGNDSGVNFFTDVRYDKFAIGLEADYKRNILDPDPTSFDSSYVQVLPSIFASLTPHFLLQKDSTFLSKITYGAESRFSVFKQNRIEETSFLRNANRLEFYPYINFNWVSYGGFNFATEYGLDYQEYRFLDKDNNNFYKHAQTISTEFRFTLDRVFGLAYIENYEVDEFRDTDLIKLQRSKKQETLNKNKALKENIIGELPNFENSLTKEKLTFKRNSYRHSQEYKFIHHQILESDENGNSDFEKQIINEAGWFDDNDIIKRDIRSSSGTEIKKQIPKNNTFELQWNNSLVKKIPKVYNYLVDDLYLKDTFEYKKIGYFNLSQGFYLDNSKKNPDSQLTRLYISSFYQASSWSFHYNDYFFHDGSDHILNSSVQKRFSRLSLLGDYRLNSFDSSNIETAKAGVQLQPIDTIGLSYLEEFDLDSNEKISTIYQIDFMPHNNCWIFNLNFKQRLDEQEVAFDFVFNFADETFKNYRTNFFDFNRLR